MLSWCIHHLCELWASLVLLSVQTPRESTGALETTQQWCAAAPLLSSSCLSSVISTRWEFGLWAGSTLEVTMPEGWRPAQTLWTAPPSGNTEKLPFFVLYLHNASNYWNSTSADSFSYSCVCAVVNVFGWLCSESWMSLQQDAADILFSNNWLAFLYFYWRFPVTCCCADCVATHNVFHFTRRLTQAVWLSLSVMSPGDMLNAITLNPAY